MLAPARDLGRRDDEGRDRLALPRCLQRRPATDPLGGGMVITPARSGRRDPSCAPSGSRSSGVDPARAPRELQRLPRGNRPVSRRLATSARQGTPRAKHRYLPRGCALDAEAGTSAGSSAAPRHLGVPLEGAANVADAVGSGRRAVGHRRSTAARSGRGSARPKRRDAKVRTYHVLPERHSCCVASPACRIIALRREP